MSEYDIDSQLQEALDLLRPVPERNPDARRRSRSRFTADLDAFFPAGAAYKSVAEAPVARPAVLPARPPVAARPRAAARPQAWYYRPVFAYLAIALLIVAAMFGGGAITVYAAGSALPGDTLYPLKLNTEQARISLTSDPAHQAELYLQFAQERMEEMNTLAGLGQYEAVGPLAIQFSRNVELAAENAERASARDPEQALRLKAQAAQSLGMFRDSFNLVILQAPPTLQAALQTALDQALLATPAVEPTPADGNQGSGNANNNNNPAGGNPSPNANPSATGGTSVNNNNQPNPNANANAAQEAKEKEEKEKKEKKDKKVKEEKDKED